MQLIKTGDKVGASEATLLNMLNISPFSFGLIIQQVFDNGSIYNPEVLDITEETLHKRFLEVSEAPRLRGCVPFVSWPFVRAHNQAAEERAGWRRKFEGEFLPVLIKSGF